MKTNQDQKIKPGEIYYFMAIAAYDIETQCVVVSLESDFLSGSLNEVVEISHG